MLRGVPKRWIASTSSFAILIFLATTTASAFQADLVALAKKERERRAKVKAPVKVLTENDGKDAATNDKGTLTTAAGDPSQTPAASSTSTAPQRADWKARADAARGAIVAADAAVKDLQKEIETVRSDLAPLSAAEAQDPMRLQKKEARLTEMNGRLAQLKDAAAMARKQFADLEAEARRSGVPPGWLR